MHFRKDNCFTIIQINDLHLPSKGEETRQLNPKSSFLYIFEQLKSNSLDIDLLIVNGDLCWEKGDIDIYKWIKVKLDILEIPYYILPGNHDNAFFIKEVFSINTEAGSSELYQEYLIIDNSFVIVLLDTSTNYLSKLQQQRIVDLGNQSLPWLIFSHHPLVNMQTYFMDTEHPLENLDSLEDVFKTLKHKPLGAFFGHYHTERTTLRGGISFFVTPPVGDWHINPDKYDFINERHELCTPCWRIIQLNKEQLSTRVKYFKMN